MDRPIEKKKWPAKRIVPIVLSVSGLLLVAFLITGKSSGTRLAVDSERISVTQVIEGEFEEYIPITGKVQPQTSVFLDLEEGGIVEEIYIESGNAIKEGDLILSFSNTNLQKQNIDSETRILENLDRLRNSKISLTEKNLLLKDQLLDLSYQILELKKTVDRYEILYKNPNTPLERDKYETARDRLTYLTNKKILLEERIRQESILRVQQSEQVDASIIRVNKSLIVLAHIADGLNVSAPISGYLSSMSAEIGQSFQRGQRIGQIDQLDSFKVRAQIDQFYISKVDIGQSGTFSFDNEIYPLRVSKIYTEVTNDSFQVDMEFVGLRAQGIKRGQTLQIDLSLSEVKTTKLVSKGGYFRHTNGRWVYLVSPDGLSARKLSVVAGRHNPQSFEIVEGLEIGDWIVSSSYDMFGDADELEFSEPLQL